MQQDGQILKTLYWAKIKPDKREYILYDSIYVKLSKKKKILSLMIDQQLSGARGWEWRLTERIKESFGW